MPLLQLLALLMLLSACSNAPAPIEDRAYPVSGKVRNYRVLRGDTLYSIAFRYGLDYRRLAAANRVAPPYTIYPGQTLRLQEADAAPPPERASARVAASNGTPEPAAAKPSPAPSPAALPAPGARTAAKAPASTSVAKGPTPAAVSRPRSAATAPRPVAATGWRWPGGGAVTRRFDSDVHKGIDVSGKRGDPIFAVADGRVVYAGNGIAGYGLLLILRHDSDYLSAYGHNDELLVVEGDQVRAGQTVARMGNTGTDTVKLHFELRRQGRPIDPLSRLPRR